MHTNIGALQYVRQMLVSMKGEISSNTIIVGDFNTSLTPMDKSTKQKISKETQKGCINSNSKKKNKNKVNGNRTILINNYLKCKWVECLNQKTETG